MTREETMATLDDRVKAHETIMQLEAEIVRRDEIITQLEAEKLTATYCGFPVVIDIPMMTREEEKKDIIIQRMAAKLEIIGKERARERAMAVDLLFYAGQMQAIAQNLQELLNEE